MFIRNILSTVAAIAVCVSIPAVDASAASQSLTTTTFEPAIADGATFVKFYSPDCSHSQKLAPTWESLAEEHKDWKSTRGFKFAEVDCLAQPDVCEDYDIVTYPTMQLFYKGKTVTRFTGRRNSERLSEFVAAQSAEFINAPAGLDLEEIGEVKVNALGKVVTLDEESYDRRTQFGPWFVEYYAPWCGHCKALAPIFEELATALKGKVNVAKVDCTTNENICHRHRIHGFPTIFMQQHGEEVEYNFHRVLEPMVDFALGAIVSSVKPVNAAEFEQARANQDISFIYTHDDKTNRDVLAAMDKQSQMFYQQINLYSTADPELVNKLSLSVPSLTVLKDNRQYNYEGSLTDEESVKRWIKEVSTPLVLTTNNDNIGTVLSRPGWLVLGVFQPEAEATPSARQELIEAAHKYKNEKSGALDFAILDASTWRSYVRGALKLEEKDLPAVVLLNSREEIHVPLGLDGRRVPVTTEALLQYIENFESNTLTTESLLSPVQKVFRVVQGKVRVATHFAYKHPMIAGFIGCAIVLSILRRIGGAPVEEEKTTDEVAEQKKKD
ncbi:hypothetical protein BGZ94_009053 [Podila epigama]|nr:hypothetical protein BGZ94_009053 [Podila epigama]